MKTRYCACVLLVCLHPSVLGAQPSAEEVVYDFSSMYEALNPSIVKIHADAAAGSGYLVSDDGLIATNHHVVRNSRYLAAQFATGRKYEPAVVVLDPRHDLV